MTALFSHLQQKAPMQILDYNNSKKYLDKILEKFKIDNRVGERYLHSKPFSFLGIGFDNSHLPILWFPQKKENRYLYQVFESYIVFNDLDENRNYLNRLQKVIVPKIIKYLSQKDEKKILALGEWYENTAIGHRLIELKIADLLQVLDKFYGELYIFPENLSWTFGVTHESFSYLAGSEEMISEFKLFFPEYARYDLGYDPFGKEPMSGDCPNC